MAKVFYRGFYREIENLPLQCAWSGEVTGKILNIYIYIYILSGERLNFFERKKEKSEKLPNGKSDQETCRDSNQGPFAYRANALPTEPQVTVRDELSSNPT